MRSLILVLVLLSLCPAWSKPAAVLDDPEDLTARSWLVADAGDRVSHMRLVVVQRGNKAGNEARRNHQSQRIGMSNLRLQSRITLLNQLCAVVSCGQQILKSGRGDSHRLVQVIQVGRANIE